LYSAGKYLFSDTSTGGVAILSFREFALCRKIHCLSEASLNFSGMVLANFRKLSIPASAAVSENKYFPVRPHTRHPQKETQKDSQRNLRES